MASKTTSIEALALLGGDPVLEKPLPPYVSIGEAERRQVLEVLDSQQLSGFFGSWNKGFRGGPKVQAFEAAWAERFATRHVISVNSNTSGLCAAIGAAGCGPGDEVIVPPTTMSATVAAPLIYGAIPVFADIDAKTFCIDFDSVVKNITAKTKAIIAVNLAGQAAPLSRLRKLADERGLILIEDNAQSPLAAENNKYCGTIGHIGVFSLNYHKHIHTGEGGMCCTDDDQLADRLRLIRNHAESVVESAGVADLTNMVGFNFRMTELSAAVGLAQLEQIEAHIKPRRLAAEALSRGIEDLAGLTAPYVRPECLHVYYCWMPRYDASVVGPTRTAFVKALNAEGFPCTEGYVRPLYNLPMFEKRRAIGADGFPFTLSDRIYEPGLCPTAERLYENELVVFEPCVWDLNEAAVELLIKAIRKVYANRDALANWEQRKSA